MNGGQPAQLLMVAPWYQVPSPPEWMQEILPLDGGILGSLQQVAQVLNLVSGGIDEQLVLFDKEYENLINDALLANRPECLRMFSNCYVGPDLLHASDYVLHAAKQRYMQQYFHLKQINAGATSQNDRNLECIAEFVRNTYLLSRLLFEPNQQCQETWLELKKHMAKIGFYEFQLFKADFLQYRLWPKIRGVTERKFATGVGQLTMIDFYVIEIDPSVLYPVICRNSAVRQFNLLPSTDFSFWDELYKKVRWNRG
uniref:FERM domain-containing protein n=1 Tax=Steinernema glaseri TaxID=37863 RepID=A0A1I8A838_9BILA